MARFDMEQALDWVSWVAFYDARIDARTFHWSLLKAVAVKVDDLPVWSTFV